MGSHVGSIFFHATKFIDVKKCIVDAYSFLFEKNGKTVFQKYKDKNDQKDGRQNEQKDTGKDSRYHLVFLNDSKVF